MKKIYKLIDEKKHEDRVLDAVKNDIRKYVKREKNKDLSNKKTMYWDFDCKIGASSDIAQAIPYDELIKALDKIKAMGVQEVYVEIVAKEVEKPVKETSDEETSN
jgi:CCR4-NOT transcriptional regulation complex NOT5 subunit